MLKLPERLQLEIPSTQRAATLLPGSRTRSGEYTEFKLDRPVRRPQQQGIRIYSAAVKPGHHRTPFDECKSRCPSGQWAEVSIESRKFGFSSREPSAHGLDPWDEILGLGLGPSEAATLWLGFLRSLQQRGLSGVRLVGAISFGAERQMAAPAPLHDV